MGGGVEPVPLTADLCARAIIAAAHELGFDPVAAAMCHAKDNRRVAVTAAAGGLNKALDIPLDRLSPIFSVAKQTVYGCRSSKPHYRRAELAAMRAVEFACWRPEAAESVAGGAEPEIATDIADETPDLRIPVEFDEAMSPAPSAVVHRPPGKISADLRPAQPVPAHVPDSDRPIRELVLEALAGAECALNSMSIAAMIDRKEMPVASSLAVLASEGLVVSEPVADGPRKLQWRLAEASEDVAA